MTHYEKIAFVIFQTVIMIALFYGVIGIFISLVHIFFYSQNPYNQLMPQHFSQIFSYLTFIVFAIVLNIVSSTLVSNIGKELKEKDSENKDE